MNITNLIIHIFSEENEESSLGSIILDIHKLIDNPGGWAYDDIF